MRILFDMFTPQDFVGGAAEYVRKVFYTLLQDIEARHLDVALVALVDSSYGNGRFSYSDLSSETLTANGIEVADIKGRTLAEVVKIYQIDKVFIGVAQYWGARFDVESLNCPVVCVVHDLVNEEFSVTHVNDSLYLDSLSGLMKYKLIAWLRKLKHPSMGINRMLPIIRQAKKNKEFQLVTVSEYSRNCISYHFDYPQDRVEVLFSPERVSEEKEEIQSATLRELVNSGKRYYLMLSANRVPKNARKALRAFQRYVESGNKDSYFVTIGYARSLFPNHIVLPFLTESDLVKAMKHCYALLFPSIFEGFGYPPVEAMSYGKPVLAANVTSIPEVLGKAPLYFSPFYESDIYHALCKLTDANYGMYAEMSCQRSAEVSIRQQADLKRLIQLLQA